MALVGATFSMILQDDGRLVAAQGRYGGRARSSLDHLIVVEASLELLLQPWAICLIRAKDRRRVGDSREEGAARHG